MYDCVAFSGEEAENGGGGSHSRDCFSKRKNRFKYFLKRITKSIGKFFRIVRSMSLTLNLFKSNFITPFTRILVDLYTNFFIYSRNSNYMYVCVRSMNDCLKFKVDIDPIIVWFSA